MAMRRTKTNSNPASSSTERTKTNSGQSSSSAEIIASNDDLLTEILTLLPIESLLRFKSVSKHFLSLISSSYFLQRLNLIPKPISGLFVSRVSLQYEFISLNSSHSRPPFKLLSFPADSSPIDVLQSCNGLLLCWSLKAEPSRRRLLNRFKYYYVYNPTTEQYTTIRKVLANPGQRRSYVYLAFDPSKSIHYKAICITRICESSEDSKYQVQIYSSKTGTWRQSKRTFVVPLDASLEDSVFWNGSLHWLSAWSDPFYFNVDEEKLLEMPKPPIPNGWENEDRLFRHLDESRGHLHLVESFDIYKINVLEIEKDYSRWLVKCQVDLSGVARAFPETFSILHLVREENDDDSYFVLDFPSKVIRYNFKKRTFRTLPNSTLAGSRNGLENLTEYSWLGAFQYTESLACVHDVSVQKLV